MTREAQELVKVAKGLIASPKYKDIRQIVTDIEAMTDSIEDRIEEEKAGMDEGRVNRWQGSSNVAILTNLKNALQEVYSAAMGAGRLLG